eukprot:UN09387
MWNGFSRSIMIKQLKFKRLSILLTTPKPHFNHKKYVNNLPFIKVRHGTDFQKCYICCFFSKTKRLKLFQKLLCLKA